MEYMKVSDLITALRVVRVKRTQTFEATVAISKTPVVSQEEESVRAGMHCYRCQGPHYN